MTQLNGLSPNALDVLKDLGNYGPTVNKQDREVKGWAYDHDLDYVVKSYYTSDDLREISRACLEIADWLDTRAEQQECK